MAQELAQLEEALKQADAAGNADDAAKLAQAISDRRAAGGQAPSAPPLPNDDPDPFANVPIEIEGFKLPQELRQQILDGRNLTDPKEKRLAAARIAGRITAMDKEGGNFADKIANGEFGAGLRGFGAGLFGIGDLAAAAGTALAGAGDENAMTFGEALEAQREFRRALEEEFPAASITGELGGSLVGGGGAIKLLGKAPVAVKSLLTLKKGQKFRNLAKLSTLGAVGGAVTEGVTEDEAATGAILGIAAGPLGAGLVKAGQVTKSLVTKALDDPAAKGIKAMAKQLGESAETLMERFLKFQAVTGKTPALVDIADPQAAKNLNALISEKTGAVAIARETAEDITRNRGVEIAAQLTGGRVTTTVTTQQAARKSITEKLFSLADQDPIKFSKKQVADVLNNPDLRDNISKTLRRKLDAVIDAEGNAVTLDGKTVNALRKELADLIDNAPAGVADEAFRLRNAVEKIGRASSQNFGLAIDESAARALRSEGVAAGRKVAGQQTDEFGAVLQVRADSPNFQAGARVGARSSIAATAQESASKAGKIARDLSENGGLVQRLRKVLPEAELRRIQEIGRVHSRSLENIGNFTPSVKPDIDRSVMQAVEDTARVMAASTGQAGTGFITNAVLGAVRHILPGANKRVLNNIARDMFDPAKTKQVITALRRANVAEEDILELFAIGATGAGSFGAIQFGE